MKVSLLLVASILVLGSHSGNSFADEEDARPASGARRMNSVERQVLQNSDCVWVDRAGNDARTIRNVVGYEVRNCSSESGRPSIVCSGTVKCDVSMPTQGGNATFTLFAEHVMCGAGSRTSCPVASRCLQDGGVLADMEVGDVLGVPEGGTKRYTPRRKPVQSGRTHDE